jgi:hypothetical protein
MKRAHDLVEAAAWNRDEPPQNKRVFAVDEVVTLVKQARRDGAETMRAKAFETLETWAQIGASGYVSPADCCGKASEELRRLDVDEMLREAVEKERKKS